MILVQRWMIQMRCGRSGRWACARHWSVKVGTLAQSISICPFASPWCPSRIADLIPRRSIQDRAPTPPSPGARGPGRTRRVSPREQIAIKRTWTGCGKAVA
jgi:hypothetical protein